MSDVSHSASFMPHPNSGQGSGSGIVTPELRLDAVHVDNYSAVVFVGGWGSSMYQYAFPGDYNDNLYDGNAATKTRVNNLINEFVAQDKYVTAVCHGTTVLAWARVNGVSPLGQRHEHSQEIDRTALNSSESR